MQPLHELFQRIKWDPEFGRGEFAIGYYDRVLDEEIVVPFTSVTLEKDRGDTFTLQDSWSGMRRIPLHRVRTVYKDGKTIWSRPARQ